MKIYNKVKIDIDTFEVIEEDSFEYDGPMVLCISSSNSGGSSSQSTIDPEAQRRMAAVAERNAQIGEEQWQYYQNTFQPYETDMANSNRRLIQPNEDLARESMESQRSLIGDRESAQRASLTSVTDELNAAKPVVSKFYEEAMNGVNVQNRMAEAGADVAQGFDASMGAMGRNMSRMGVGANSVAAMDQMNMAGTARAKATAGAQTQARNQAENENFGRLGTAMQARQGAMGAGGASTPYMAGDSNQGGFQLGSPAQTSMGAFGNAIGANQAGMGTLTTSSNKGSGWGIL